MQSKGLSRVFLSETIEKPLLVDNGAGKMCCQKLLVAAIVLAS